MKPETETNNYISLAFINSGQCLPLVYFDKYKDRDIDTKTITLKRLIYLTEEIDLDITKADFICITQIPKEYKEEVKVFVKTRIRELNLIKDSKESFNKIKNLKDQYEM